jgi:lysophospholipase L1-like esterase
MMSLMRALGASRLLVLLVSACSCFVSGKAGADVFTNVPEAVGYNLIYSLSIPNSASFNGATVPYSVNNSGSVTRGSFDRVAYYLELQPTGGGPLQYVFTSMNAFTDDARRIGVPNQSGSFFQRPVTGVNVASNVAGIATGANLSGYNLEFWRTNYTQANGANVPNANNATFDFGDQPTVGAYGSMQIHNNGNLTSVFAYNRWGGGSVGTSDLGIGNRATADPDWTFAQNANAYTVKNLQVLVRQAATAQQHRTEIMPLGDSITLGTGTPGGYRTSLQQQLTNAGKDFEFVGSQVDNPSAALSLTGRVTHEGHGQYRIDQIDDNLNGLSATGGTNNNGFWLNPTIQPDFIMVVVGTNDFEQNFDRRNAINRLNTLIAHIVAQRPDANLIVTNLIERTDLPAVNAKINTEFNPFVPSIVNQHAQAGQRVFFLDLHSLINPATDLSADGLHPNQAGYDKIGGAFFTATQNVPEPGVVGLSAAAMIMLVRRLR